MADLGTQPLCESFLSADQLPLMEPHYPLHVMVCGTCFLAQAVHDVPPAAIFHEYAYFSSFSTAWLDHAHDYVDAMIERFGLSPGSSRVLEIASNDGYLLQYFEAAGIEVQGVDPSENVAAAAIAKGVPTIVDFFGRALAGQLRDGGFLADLIVANNVLAHTPELHDLVGGIPMVLAESGVATFEFPHILNLIEQNQFDTIYHEHWSYLSLGTTIEIFAHHGLTVFDVEELWTHGGSLRLFVRHESDSGEPVTDNVRSLLDRERDHGLRELDTYRSFGERAEATKRRLLSLLISEKDAGRSIAAYGAPGKGNTLLNYCGIRTDLIDYVCDKNPYKHGRYTPGTRIPIFAPEMIDDTRPDLVLILPWNLKDEITGQLAHIAEWGGRFVVPIPEPMILEATG